MNMLDKTEDPRESIRISPSLFKSVLGGISECIHPTSHEVESIERWIDRKEQSHTWLEWSSLVSATFAANGSCLDVADFCLSLAALDQAARTAQEANATILHSVWRSIRHLLTNSGLMSQLYCEVAKSQSNFVAPLCATGQEADTQYQIRLHIRLSDGSPYDSGLQFHSFNTACWILCGEVDRYTAEEDELVGSAHPYGLESTSDAEAVFCSDRRCSTRYTRDMLLFDAEGTYSRTCIAADTAYASIELMSLNSSTPMFTSPSGSPTHYVQVQPSRHTGVNTADLVRLLDSIRGWESDMTAADLDAQGGRWEHALRACNDALHICNTKLSLAKMDHYRYVTVDYLCFVNRSLGRYDLALAAAEGVLPEMRPGSLRAGMYAEIAAVYRLTSRFEEAKSAFKKEYDEAIAFNLPQHACRAIGNLGMINYQLYLQDKQEIHLALAISQLKERVERARGLQAKGSDYAATLEIIGLSRLSLCYTLTGATSDAVLLARSSFEKSSNNRDPSVIAMSRFFYGRALFHDGQRQAALAQFFNAEGLTPAMALCKEPSNENLGFLRELSDLDVPFDANDEKGYSALQYAVANGHEAAKAIVYEALCRQIGSHLADEMCSDAILQKGYREIFHDEMRPTLLRRDSHGLQDTRQLYARVLESDAEKRESFDSLKFVCYSDFVSFGRFPRSSDGLTQEFTTNSTEQKVRFIIFLSYRWISPDPWTLRSNPDDAENTQYRRTIAAIDSFLLLNPSVEAETLGIWVDFACIDQESPQRGIAALPMVIAQCNALISLVDDEYHTRAWCSVEVMMIQRLRAAYKLYSWYEHVRRRENDGRDNNGDAVWGLREGSVQFRPDLATKRLRFEKDRPRVMFLERQSELLC